MLVSDSHGVSRGSGLLGEVTQHRLSEKAFTASNGSWVVVPSCPVTPTNKKAGQSKDQGRPPVKDLRCL